jgi:hypothetical protein
MAKPAPRVRLLRSLTRAVKSQQSMLAKLLDACAPAPKKPPRKAAPSKPPSKRAAAQTAPLGLRRHARPGLPPATGKWLAGQYPLPLKPGQAVAQGMSYWLYLPERVPDSVARHGSPLIVMLHGCHQSATQFVQGTRMNQLAEDKGYAA